MYFCPRYVLASLIPEPYWLRRCVTSSASQGSGLGPSGLGAGLGAAGAAGLAAAGAAGLAPVAGAAAGFAGSAGFGAAAGFAGSAALAAAGVSALAAGALGGGTVGAAEVGDGSADALAPPDPAPSPGAAGAPAGEDDSGETGSVPLVSSGIPMPLFCAGSSLVSWNYKFYQLEALTILCGGHAAL